MGLSGACGSAPRARPLKPPHPYFPPLRSVPGSRRFSLSPPVTGCPPRSSVNFFSVVPPPTPPLPGLFRPFPSPVIVPLLPGSAPPGLDWQLPTAGMRRNGTDGDRDGGTGDGDRVLVALGARTRYGNGGTGDGNGDRGGNRDRQNRERGRRTVAPGSKQRGWGTVIGGTRKMEMVTGGAEQGWHLRWRAEMGERWRCWGPG